MAKLASSVRFLEGVVKNNENSGDGSLDRTILPASSLSGGARCPNLTGKPWCCTPRGRTTPSRRRFCDPVHSERGGTQFAMQPMSFARLATGLAPMTPAAEVIERLRGMIEAIASPGARADPTKHRLSSGRLSESTCLAHRDPPTPPRLGKPFTQVPNLPGRSR